MGLGKTISCLAHICATLDHAALFADEQDLSSPLNKHGNPTEIVSPRKCTKATLIIAPLSTVSNWEEQLQTHVAPRTLTTYVYHGANREGNLEKLSAFDCIITTFSTLSQDFMRLKRNLASTDSMSRLAASPLHHLKFFRIILVPPFTHHLMSGRSPRHQRHQYKPIHRRLRTSRPTSSLSHRHSTSKPSGRLRRTNQIPSSGAL
jgi:SNF2-related domain